MIDTLLQHKRTQMIRCSLLVFLLILPASVFASIADARFCGQTCGIKEFASVIASFFTLVITILIPLFIAMFMYLGFKCYWSLVVEGNEGAYREYLKYAYNVLIGFIVIVVIGGGGGTGGGSRSQPLSLTRSGARLAPAERKAEPAP